MRRIGSVLGLVVAMSMVFGAVPAVAAPYSWEGTTTLGTPTIATASGYTLSGLDCRNGSSCVAVDDQGQAVVYNADLSGTPSVWTIDPGRALHQLSCPAATMCVSLDDPQRRRRVRPDAPGLGADPIGRSRDAAE